MAELGLAIAGLAGTVDVCFKLGKELIAAYKSLKDTESELHERIVCLQTIWFRTDAQLKFLVSIWSSLDAAHQRLHNDTIEILASKLKLAVLKVENVVKQDFDNSHRVGHKINRWRYVQLKGSIDQLLEELESWQKRFDPSWFLIMKMADSRVDHELESADQQTIGPAASLRRAVWPSENENLKIFLPADGLELATDAPVPFSSFRLVQRKGSSRWLIFETVHLPTGMVASTFTKNIRDIARRLSHAEPLTFQLLNCYGVIRHVSAPSSPQPVFTFVFRVPEGFSSPTSLRGTLHSGNGKHSLTERLHVAKDLARAVSYVHSFGFVHKNIRPETIVLLKGNTNHLGTPFLAGFEVIRGADDRTARHSDDYWHRNLYRHPQRQGVTPREDFVMQHDIYSLGVCLLELGLFQSLVIATDDERDYSPSKSLRLSLEELVALEPEQLKAHLMTIAEQELPRIMGTKYTSIVTTCLTCLDEDNVDFGDESEFQDEDGILVNVRYIEKVLVQLNEITV